MSKSIKEMIDELAEIRAEAITYGSHIIDFNQKIGFAIKENNLKLFQEIMSPIYIPELGKEYKEMSAFKNLHSSFLYAREGEDLLNYLIFEYNITESNSIAKIPDLNSEVKKMFDSRGLNSELSSELNISEEKNNRKPKV